MADSQRFRSWIVDLEIHVFGSISNDYTSFLAKTRLDISKFASDDQERTVGIPVRCIVRGFMAEALLTVTLRISTRQAKGSILPAITRGLSLRASSSRAFPHTDSGDSRPSLGRIMVVPSSSIPSQPPDEEKDGLLMVGWWEEKTVTSRDGLLELSTEIFFASIDQRSEKAAGESACSVLAAVFADWLHRNPGDLPLRCQFDELVREGSSEWRSLCADAGHAARFSDRHFDLDTVLTARLRPLTVLTEKSYVGFFAMPDEGTELIQGAMSFDQMWDEVVGAEAGEDRVYIAGWNDHFFVLKVEKEAIYLIDTLGERLFEGCNQAYILKFDRESRVFSKDLAADGGGGGAAARHLVCRGLGSCKEFIKGFLAAVPLRELQEEMERGLTREDRHHRLLQIEFHYTSPL
ncbi:unnamed protein product [Spirodela intermedia]|uniref:Uncharacterized protein n=1 Tax=Spirodela intermedia TaxID=51605 RepID=A0A7I8IBV2_SPIIN|nr:unnamed protein product [Spirodela intermedia]CAA6654813.1 unnamed protein product [Spirodela intermedia]